LSPLGIEYLGCLSKPKSGEHQLTGVAKPSAVLAKDPHCVLGGMTRPASSAVTGRSTPQSWDLDDSVVN